jgi:23S rRNA pseudouridine1911/1915/1917 synthase
VPLNRGWSYREQVGPDADGQTVLAYLSATRLHSTEDEWAERLARGEVEVEGARVRKEFVVHAGQTVVWHRPPWDEPTVPTNFEVVHEDDAIVVVNKPSGLPTMPAGGFLDHTLLTLVRHRYPTASPLHRLGRGTSGVVLFARNKNAASRLARAWRDRGVKKTYRALGLGSTRSEMFVIDVPIGPVMHPVIGSIQAACDGGRPSHSVAIVLERRHDQTLFSIDITTGRPHQIRIHMAYAGHPLIGDSVYEAGGGLKRHPGLPGDGGYFLHAESLQFEHPATGQHISVSATPPPELQTHQELANATVIARSTGLQASGLAG